MVVFPWGTAVTCKELTVLDPFYHGQGSNLISLESTSILQMNLLALPFMFVQHPHLCADRMPGTSSQNSAQHGFGARNSF